ncbi:MAG: DEAD/DEAH box helicase [Arcticibacter sp.]
MYILKQFQIKAVNALLGHIFEVLRLPALQTPILLEAPTGSGKTVMMASFLERLTDELSLQPGLHDNVAFIWFAPNTLHIQSFHSIQKLYTDTNKLRCTELDNLSTYPVLNPKDLLFVNWSSVDSLKKIWRRDNETGNNLESLIENTKGNGTEIILIIDEAHLGAFTGKQAIAVRNLIKAKCEIMITATPNYRPQRAVFISRHEVTTEQMIKKGVRLNIGLDPEQQNGENLHIHLLRTAFSKKKELQEKYNKELGEDKVNPLLLIQLPSDNNVLSEEDKSIRDTLVGLLNAEYGISTSNGRLAVWLSGERDTDGLEDINGLQDVLVFKQAIAQGWDCPRAAVLVSYRNVQSPDFGVQTVGRILRMPHQRHYDNDDLNYGYVYTNIESSRINFVPSDADYFHQQYAIRKENPEWTFDKLTTARIINDRPSLGVLNGVFEQTFFQIMENRYGIIQVPEIDLFTGKEQEGAKTQAIVNRQAMIANGWGFEIDERQIHIPADIEVDTYEVNSMVLNNHQIKHFAITTAQFSSYFERFCYDNITRLNRSKSWRKLRETLIHFAEYYLNMFETDAHKLFLYPQNKALLIPHITQALEKFEAWQAAKGNANRRLLNSDWEVPELRYYSDLYNREEIDSHALEPFWQYHKVSSVEETFKVFLIQHESELEWWYKNGDNGKEHFAVPYENLQNELRLFHVDFIIKFKSGTIGLFDTKTRRSDADAPLKHNALIEYIQAENSNRSDRQLIGGVLISTETNDTISFRFSRNKITDTDDLAGWDFLNPAEVDRNSNDLKS